MGVQVDKKHYDFLEYVDANRWNSYYVQIKEILNCNYRNIVLIGAGDGVVPLILKMINPSLDILTVDFDSSLSPDICCDILQLSSKIKDVDCIICCQVLEHLPFDNFNYALAEIYKSLIPNGLFIMSLPDSGTEIGIKIDFPRLHIKKGPFKLCMKHKGFEFNGEHYWEVNSSFEYRNKAVLDRYKHFFSLERCFLVPNNTYHRFYIGRKREVI